MAGVVLLGLGLAACGKLGLGGAGADQMSWARSALERNNRLEVVASDPQTGTFTVRLKDTGELRMIRVDEVVGAPPGVGASSSAAPSAPTPASSEPPAPEGSATASAASMTPNSVSATASTTSAAVSGKGELASQGGLGDSVDGSPAAARKVVAMSNVPRTGFQSDSAPAAAVPNPNGDVASITPGGRTLESGPGYVIKAASKAASSTHTDRPRSATTTAAVERRHDPIICQGDRLLQIDNRNLEFDGDAVTAEDGCEIHITNSHISAKGVGISARAANVHIDNSQIEGEVASVDASNGAQVYASSSTFKGISRRLGTSAFHDMGGNVWN